MEQVDLFHKLIIGITQWWLPPWAENEGYTVSLVYQGVDPKGCNYKEHLYTVKYYDN